MPLTSPASALRPVKAGSGTTNPRLAVPEFSDLLDGIYAGHSDEQPWLATLKRIRGQLGASWAALMLRPASPLKPAWIVAAGGPLALASESPHALGSDIPPTGPFRELSTDRVVVVERAGVLASLHVIGVDIIVSDGLRARLRIARALREGVFSDQERAYVQMLLPHLARAMRACEYQHSSRQEIQLLSRVVDNLALGIAILGETGDVIQTNDCADQLFRKGKGIRLVRSRLQCDSHFEERKLYTAIKRALESRTDGAAGNSNTVVAIKPVGGTWLSLLVRPLAPGPLATGPRAPAVALFIRSPEQDHEVPHKVIQVLFGLTATETVLALEMANGYTIDEAAEAMGIRRNTARTHLRSIFAKVGVRRQTALMRVILNSVATMV